MNLGLQQLKTELEEKEQFVMEQYQDIKINFWKFYSISSMSGSPLSNAFVEYFKKVFDEIEDDSTAINKYFMAKRGGEKFGELDGVDCKLDTSIKELILFGIEDEAKLLIGSNEMTKKLLGKPYNEYLCEAFTAEESPKLKEMQNIIAWRKILGISDTSMDEQLFRALQKPFTQYIREINAEERDIENEQYN